MNLTDLANNGMMIVIPAAALQEIIREDRLQSFNDGVRAALAANTHSLEEPLTKREAAKSLGVSVGTIDNLRKRGDLESLDYGDAVRFDVDEILRYKRTHRSLYANVCV